MIPIIRNSFLKIKTFLQEKKAEDWAVKIFYSLSIIFGIITISSTYCNFGGGDSIVHYEFAHWGWKHPELLFKHWGKPVFTILASPFAQFGINGVRIYNMLAGLLTSWLAYKTVKTLKMQNPVIVIFFVVFTPIYFATMFSSLTEVTFSCFLMASVYLFFKDKYIFSAIAFSFLPIIRTESIILIPTFIFVLIIKRKYTCLPFLLTGFVLFSFLGMSFYNNNILWLITEMPYRGGTSEIYHSGSLFHFVNKTNLITGYIIGVLSFTGLIMALWHFSFRDNFKNNKLLYFILLIPVPYLIFFVAHSFVWWKGIGNSAGLLRVMTAVTPLAAVTALYSYNFLTKNLNTKIVTILSVIVLSVVMSKGITTYKHSFYKSNSQQLLLQSVDYIKSNSLDTNKIYYFDPLVTFGLNLDKHDESKCNYTVPNINHPSTSIKNNSIIIWDAHFGPNEGRLPLENLMNDNGLVLLKSFFPKTPFKVLGGHSYAIYIFQKANNQNNLLTNKFNEFITLNDNIQKDPDSTLAQVHETYYKIDSTEMFLPMYSTNCDNLKTDSNIEIIIGGYIYTNNANTTDPLIVAAIHNNNENLYYNTFHPFINNDIQAVNDSSIEWSSFSNTFLIPGNKYNNSQLKIYFWNLNHNTFYFKDLVIKLKYLK